MTPTVNSALSFAHQRRVNSFESISVADRKRQNCTVGTFSLSLMPTVYSASFTTETETDLSTATDGSGTHWKVEESLTFS